MPDESDERGDPERSTGSREDPEERPPSPSETTDTAEEDPEVDSDAADESDDVLDEGYTAEQLEAMTKDELYEVAQEFEVEGRSRMRKATLLEAVKEAALEETEEDEVEAIGEDEERTTDEVVETTVEDDETGDAESEEPPAGDARDGDENRPAVETDGEGYAGGEYVGERLSQYKPPSWNRSVHKRRKKERERSSDDDWDGLSTPPDDEEMPLADHIEEMMSRLLVVLLFGAAWTAIGLLWASQAISIIWFDVIPQPTDGELLPHIYHPLELWMTRIKVSALLGVMAALPMFVYQCYLFMRPGLYPNERRYYLAAVPTSVVLAGLGMVFSYLVILPILFAYFTFYSEPSADIAYGLGDTFNLIITLTGFLAIVFQIPLFIMLAIMMGVTTRQWLADKRLYFWAAFAGLSFMFTFDPTFMAPVFVAITMIILFEGTLLLLKWTGR